MHPMNFAKFICLRMTFVAAVVVVMLLLLLLLGCSLIARGKPNLHLLYTNSTQVLSPNWYVTRY
jgi:hypothetical protein